VALENHAWYFCKVGSIMLSWKWFFFSEMFHFCSMQQGMMFFFIGITMALVQGMQPYS